MNYARDHAVNNLRYNEHRYVAVGRYIADAPPPRSVFLAMQESGSVRYYAGRETIRWDFVPAADLDGVLDQLRRLGYHPYLLLETWEEAQFKSQFHSAHRARGSGLGAGGGLCPRREDLRSARERRDENTPALVAHLLSRRRAQPSG